MKKELNLEDLEKVTGGFRKQTNCPDFVQALSKQNINECDNCYYYSKNASGNYECRKDKKANKVYGKI